MADVQTDLTALRDELLAEGKRCDSFHATMGTGYHVAAQRLTDLLGSLPPQEKLDLPDVGPAPVGMIATLREHVKRFRALGGVPEMCDLTWKLCNENEELKAKLAALGSLPVPDTEVLQALITKWRQASATLRASVMRGTHGETLAERDIKETISFRLDICADELEAKLSALLSQSAQEPPKAVCDHRWIQHTVIDEQSDDPIEVTLCRTCLFIQSARAVDPAPSQEKDRAADTVDARHGRPDVA